MLAYSSCHRSSARSPDLQSSSISSADEVLEASAPPHTPFLNCVVLSSLLRCTRYSRSLTVAPELLLATLRWYYSFVYWNAPASTFSIAVLCAPRSPLCTKRCSSSVSPHPCSSTAVRRWTSPSYHGHHHQSHSHFCRHLVTTIVHLLLDHRLTWSSASRPVLPTSALSASIQHGTAPSALLIAARG